jgi:hypothetical protein
MSSLLVFCLEWCSNFVVRNRVYGLQHNSTHSHTLSVYTVLYVYFGKGGGVGEVREKVEGQQFTRGVENTNMTDCISSL